MSCKTFPYDVQEDERYVQNPAIQLFGNRFFIDQTSIEILIEFLLVAISEKSVGGVVFCSPFPEYDFLKSLNNEKLKYASKSRLNLKLFSFLSSSRLDSRHKTHREHYQEILEKFLRKIQISGYEDKKEEVVRTLENLFLGFQGVGAGRNWCTQNFLPISSAFISRESIWRETKANKKNVRDWNGALSFFDNQRVFMARGGELLYLQVCNALRQSHDDIKEWVNESGVMLSTEEQNPAWLHEQLSSCLKRIMDLCPSTLTEVAEFIDNGLDSETAEKTDTPKDKERYVATGWCPVESWQEGYLFAVDLLRLCKTDLDIIDRIYLLECACAMQVLRSLAMQSARYSTLGSKDNFPGFRLAISAFDEKNNALKRISRHSLKHVEKMIFQAIRNEQIKLISPKPKNGKEKGPEELRRDADKSYGAKLFVNLSKKIGFVTPKKGPGARFVLNEQILRLLVLTTVPIGGNLTFETFKRLIEARYGIVFDAEGFKNSCDWMGRTNIYLPSDTDAWLQSMLEAAGLLISLSDSCALVVNPATENK
jgi:hypothetical protein